MIDGIMMSWNSSNGGSDRVKFVASNRVDEFLSYGWLSMDNGAKKEVIPEEVEISLPVAPIIKKRGRPHKWK